MIGKMERTSNKSVESYVGAVTIASLLCVQTAIRNEEGAFQTQRMLLSREAVETLVPLLREFLKEEAL